MSNHEAAYLDSWILEVEGDQPQQQQNPPEVYPQWRGELLADGSELIEVEESIKE